MASTPSRAQLQRERNAAEAGVQNDETPAGGMLLARDVYAVQMGHTVPLSGGPSTTYEATIGRSAHAGEAPVPALPTGADIARAAQADRVSPSVGSTPLAQRLDGLKAFQPKLLSCVAAGVGGCCSPVALASAWACCAAALRSLPAFGCRALR